MFDVPVPEVTVSSIPVIVNTVSQTSQIKLPHISSSKTHLQTQTLLPAKRFHLLEPLDLAGTVMPLEEVFTNSLADINSAASLRSHVMPGATVAPVVTLTTATRPENNQQNALITAPAKPVTANLHKPVTANLHKPALVLLREELKQCVETDGPDSITQPNITFQVWLRGMMIGDITHNDAEDAEHQNSNEADYVARSLQEMLAHEPLNPDDITPVLEADQPAIRLSSDVLVKLTSRDNSYGMSSNQQLPNSEWVAISWSDQLRQAMGAKSLDAGDVHVMLTGLNPSEQKLNGLASWYGPYFHGRQTANGETFDQNTLTAAHKSLPFNTVLQVRNLNNDRTVVVRINDRGPYIGKRSLDLSKAAAQCLGSETTGVIPYEAVILEKELEAALAN